VIETMLPLYAMKACSISLRAGFVSPIVPPEIVTVLPLRASEFLPTVPPLIVTTLPLKA
jgi:hypothetical protein